MPRDDVVELLPAGLARGRSGIGAAALSRSEVGDVAILVADRALELADDPVPVARAADVLGHVAERDDLVLARPSAPRVLDDLALDARRSLAGRRARGCWRARR